MFPQYLKNSIFGVSFDLQDLSSIWDEAKNFAGQLQKQFEIDTEPDSGE